MALNVLTLTNGLRAFLDPSFDDFAGFPEDEIDAAAQWAAAVDAYTGTGLLLSPLSTAGAAAKPLFQAALDGMSAPGLGPAIFDGAFVLYATTLAAGMAPAFVATPPPPGGILSGLASQAALAIVPPGIPPAVQLAALAAVVDGWFKLGSATPSGGGPPVTWT